jgi:hypothetical protein
VCARVGNQRSRGVVIVRLQSSLQSLLHQRRDLHQSTYLYLTEDQKPISHQPASSSMRHCMVLPPDAGCTSYTYVAEHAATRPPSTLALQERRSSRPRLTSIAAPTTGEEATSMRHPGRRSPSAPPSPRYLF